MEAPSRIVLGIVAACVLLTVVVLMRSGTDEEEEAAPRPGSFSSERARPGAGSARRDGGGFSSSSSGDVERPRLGNSGFDPVRPGALRAADGKIEGGAAAGKGLDEGVSSGDRNLAAEPVPPPPADGGIVAGAALPADPDALAAVVPGLPENASMAVPFDGSGAEALGSMVPIVDENVIYDLDDGAYFPPDARFAYSDAGQVKNEGGTIAFWLKPNWDGDDGRNASLIQFRTENWSNRIQVFKNGKYLRFLIADNNGTETDVSIDMGGADKWIAGEWHHVAVTWGDALLAIYSDGVLRAHQPYLGEILVPTGTELYVGSDKAGGGPGADATLQDLVIVPEALDGEAVHRMYAQGR